MRRRAVKLGMKPALVGTPSGFKVVTNRRTSKLQWIWDDNALER